MQRILPHSRRLLKIARPQPLRQIPRFYANMSSTTGAASTDTQASTIASSSGITPSSLQKTLTEKLSASYVDVEDMSGKHLPPITPTPNAPPKDPFPQEAAANNK